MNRYRRGVIAWSVLVVLFELVMFVTSATAAPPAEPYAWKSVTIGANGLINGIVYNPAARDSVFINTDMGGAYRWDAAEKRWACMTDWAAADDASAKHMGVETLAVDPTDASRVYMAVGTYMSPTAIMRSADGGRTWKRSDSPIKSNGNGSARNTGQRMLVDPNLPSTLYYGTRVDGLWKSADTAATWSRVAAFSTIGFNEGWGKNTGLLFVQFDAAGGVRGKTTPTIYVGVFEPRAGRPRIFRSRDAGETWSSLAGTQFTDADTFPQRMALTRDGKSAFITFGSSTKYPGPSGLSHGRVWKITGLDGDSPLWTDVTPEATCSFSAVALDPAHNGTVYVGEINNYSPADRIWRSTDAGTTWAAMHPNDHRDDSSAPYVKSARVHWLGDLQIDPFDPNVAMFTTGYGLYRTSNLSADEPAWTFFNVGFEQSACTALVSPPSGPVHLISAIGDRDGYRHEDFDRSPELGAHGQKQGLGRGSSTDIDAAWNDPNVVVRAAGGRPFVQVSLHNAVTWKWMPDAPADAKSGGRVAVSADGTRIVWSPPRAASLVSRRTGDDWSPWVVAKTDAGELTGAIVVSDPNVPTAFFATAGSRSFRSTDGGATWTRLGDHSPTGLRCIRAVPGHADHLWAVGRGEVGLWRSTDGGANWSRVGGDRVPVAYVLGLGAARSTSSYPALYIGGRVDGRTGVFRSDDEGATFIEVTDADHQFGYLTVIQGDPRVFGRVYLGTNGRGIVMGDK